MNAMALIEWLQTRRVLTRQMLVLLALALAARYLGGGIGILLAILLLPPNLATGIGLGTFGEEFAKGQHRFLHTLPIGRNTLFGVKLASGLLGLMVFGGLIVVALFAVPGPIDNRLVDLSNPATVAGLLLFAATLGLFNYGAGLLAGMICRSQKSAALAATLLGYGVLIGIGVLFVQSGGLVDPVKLMFVLPIGGVGLIAAAWCVYRVRNPFIDEPWRWRATGAAGAGVTALVVSGLLVALPGTGGWAMTGMVANAQPDPTGRAVYVTLTTVLGEMNGVVLDAEGRRIGPVARNVSPAGSPSSPWRPDAREVLLHRLPSHVGRLTGRDVDGGLMLLNVDTGETRDVTLDPTVVGESSFSPVQWSADGRRLLGWAFSASANESPRVVIHDVETGVTSSVQHAADEQVEFVPGGTHLAAVRWSEAGQQVRLIDGATGASAEYTVPSDPNYASIFAIDPAGQGLAFIRPLRGLGRLRLELVHRNLATGEETVLLPATELPSTFALPMSVGALPSIQPIYSPGGRLLLSVATPPESGAFWLVRDGSRLELIRAGAEASLGVPQFSPDDSRALFVEHHFDETDYSGGRSVLRVIDLGPEPREVLTHDTGAMIGFVHWMGDDALLYVESVPAEEEGDTPEARVWRVDVATGEREQFYPRKPDAE